jgi:hypothetical protein
MVLHSSYWDDHENMTRGVGVYYALQNHPYDTRKLFSAFMNLKMFCFDCTYQITTDVASKIF